MKTLQLLFVCALAQILSLWLTVNAQDTIHDPAEYISHTLPVLYITTQDSAEIVSQEVYLDGTYYFDPMGVDGMDSIGSRDEQLPLKIKGRGNSTWNYDKKPYRLKLDKKAALAGMNKSKHFVLLAHIEQHHSLFQDEIGFFISRQMGMPWTPNTQPIEVVINGDYRGLYTLAEKIRVDKDHVDIFEQEDGDPENSDVEHDEMDVTGGWLLEIDNYSEPGQILLNDYYWNKTIRITPHTPEVLSPKQRNYITDLLTTVNNLIYTEDKNSTEWEQFIDLDALARFYVCREVVYDIEAFIGSCYFYKDKGDSTKFIFGPVWDFGFSMLRWNENQENFLYNTENTFPQKHNHWIGEFCKFPRFQEAVKRYWRTFKSEVSPKVVPYIQSYADRIRTVCLNGEYQRWPQYNENRISSRLTSYINQFQQHQTFLSTQWDLHGDINNDGEVDVSDVNQLINVILGKIDASEFYNNPDLTGDSLVDVSDVNALINILLGKQ